MVAAAGIATPDEKEWDTRRGGSEQLDAALRAAAYEARSRAIAQLGGGAGAGAEISRESASWLLGEHAGGGVAPLMPPVHSNRKLEIRNVLSHSPFLALSPCFPHIPHAHVCSMPPPASHHRCITTDVSPPMYHHRCITTALFCGLQAPGLNVELTHVA